MASISEVVREIHRRSLWQVLGIFLAASWVVLQVVDLVTQTAGLPDWTPAMAFVLLLIGLPFCLATAFVQEGMPGRHGGAEGAPAAAPTSGPDAEQSGAPEPVNLAVRRQLHRVRGPLRDRQPRSGVRGSRPHRRRDHRVPASHRPVARRRRGGAADRQAIPGAGQSAFGPTRGAMT